MKKKVCIILFVLFSVLCAGCEPFDFGDLQIDGPRGVCFAEIEYLSLSDGEQCVGGYNSFFDKKNPPRIELNVDKKYDIRLWVGTVCFGYSGDTSWYRAKHENGFNPEIDKFDNGDIDLSKSYEFAFEYDENIMAVQTELNERTEIDDEEETIEKRTVYSVIGKEAGETNFTVAVYSKSQNKTLVYTYNLTLVFTAAAESVE